MKSPSQHQGFTLIELVVVIVILGILAATALPKFVDLGNDARTAQVNALAGTLKSTAALWRSKCAATGIRPNGGTNTVINGTTYTLYNCYPEAGGNVSTGFIQTLVDYDANIFEVTAPNGTATTRFRVKTVANPDECYAQYTESYDPNIPPVVAVKTDGC